MRRFLSEIVMPCGPERVFAALSDLGSVPRWMPEVVGIEVEGGGPLEAGAVLVETRHFGRRQVQARILVEVHRGPGRAAGAAALPYRHRASSTVAGVCCRFDYRMHAHPEGSRVELVIEAESQSLFGRLAEGGILRVMRRSEGAQLLRLREFLEGA